MTTQTPVITGVDFITVPTRDFDRASEFYGTVLGLRRSVQWGSMPAAEFETGTLTIAVMQSDAFGLAFSPHTHPIALRVDDVAAARAGPRGPGHHVRRRDDRQRRLPHGPFLTTRTATRSCSTTATPRATPRPSA